MLSESKGDKFLDTIKKRKYNQHILTILLKNVALDRAILLALQQKYSAICQDSLIHENESLHKHMIHLHSAFKLLIAGVDKTDKIINKLKFRNFYNV